MSFNLMAANTICSDFGAQKIKSDTISTVSPSISREVMGPDAMIIVEKAREFQKSIYFCFIDYAKAFDCVDHNKLWKVLRDGNARPSDLPLENSVFRSGSKS